MLSFGTASSVADQSMLDFVLQTTRNKPNIGKHEYVSSTRQALTHRDVTSGTLVQDRRIGAGEPAGSQNPTGSCTPSSFSNARKGDAV